MPDPKTVQHVSLRLARLEEMVEAPDPAPLSGQFEERSGVDRILDAARAHFHRRLAAIEAKLVLDEQPSTEERRKVDDALKALWRYQDERLGEQLVTIRRDGFRALAKGCIFLLICMAISAIAGNSTILPDLVQSLVSEGFIIAGWVALWLPMELLLYEWWPVSRDRKLYRMIAEMKYSIEAPRPA